MIYIVLDMLLFDDASRVVPQKFLRKSNARFRCECNEWCKEGLLRIDIGKNDSAAPVGM